MYNHVLTTSSPNCPISEYFRMVGMAVGNGLFRRIVDGEPVAETGLPRLDDHKPGPGLTPKTRFPDRFDITG